MEMGQCVPKRRHIKFRRRGIAQTTADNTLKHFYKHEFSRIIPQHSLTQFILHPPTRLWRWNRQSVPKRWHIKFRRRGIAQTTADNILKHFYKHEFLTACMRHDFGINWKCQISRNCDATEIKEHGCRYAGEYKYLCRTRVCNIESPPWVTRLLQNGYELSKNSENRAHLWASWFSEFKAIVLYP
jgi:hypothetical protein